MRITAITSVVRAIWTQSFVSTLRNGHLRSWAQRPTSRTPVRSGSSWIEQKGRPECQASRKAAALCRSSNWNLPASSKELSARGRLLLYRRRFCRRLSTRQIGNLLKAFLVLRDDGLKLWRCLCEAVPHVVVVRLDYREAEIDELFQALPNGRLGEAA